MHPAPDHFILRVSCPAVSGIVAAVTTYLAEHGCYISEMAQFDDEDNGRFFMRAVFRYNTGVTGDTPQLEAGFADVAQRFDMQWSLHSSARPMRVLLMVSKFDHCLSDLLYRHAKGELDMQITAVVSNHLDLRPMAERQGIRFVYLPVSKDTKAEQEAALLRIVEDTGTELVVLARYMQILSDDLCRQLSGRAINIHHSFLPGFKGAKPYHQAYNKGVKMVGATAHYINNDLDEGPIIAQGVEVVDHSHYPEDLIAKGRDIECLTLARAVGYHIERRVFLNANRTVVL